MEMDMSMKVEPSYMISPVPTQWSIPCHKGYRNECSSADDKAQWRICEVQTPAFVRREAYVCDNHLLYGLRSFGAIAHG